MASGRRPASLGAGSASRAASDPLPKSASGSVRHLVLVLGDQLDAGSSAFDGFDPASDRVWMCEALEESTHIPVSRQRIAIFLAAMRHFAIGLRERGWPLIYRSLGARAQFDVALRDLVDVDCFVETADLADPPEGTGSSADARSLAEALAETLTRLRPERVILTEPGDWRVARSIEQTCALAGIVLEVRVDRHFLCGIDEFARYAAGRKQLRLEYFYREMRRRHRVLMIDDPSSADGVGPAGGQWNFDADNRESFGANGPGWVPEPLRFEPDAITRELIDWINSRFVTHVGDLSEFGWPVTREQALAALDDFIGNRLVSFGRWQDAMWQSEPWLHHSLLSAALNLKLLSPREVIDAAEKAWRDGYADLSAVEGFIRQILGWREYVRGLYWLKMPDYVQLNELGANEPLPAFYWSGDTPMACLRDAVGQTLRLGYAHHIQRLMVTGLYALLFGVEPRQIHEWYLAVYVDAVEWVELPNTLGMSQFADGGLMASKPYAATGKYIERMSNYCRGCRYRPAERTGDRACPFTTLYWDFLARHEARLAANPRMALQVRNLARVSADEMRRIRERAQWIRSGGLDQHVDS